MFISAHNYWVRSRSKFRLNGDGNGAVRAILYVRVSTAKQAAKGVSVDNQEEVLRAEAERRGITDYIVITDAESAKQGHSRAGFEEARRLLRSGERNLLIATKLDRISRGIIDTMELAEACQKEHWHCIVLAGTLTLDTTTSDGLLRVGIMSLMAQAEREMISARTRDAMAYKRRRGDSGLISSELEERIIADYKKGDSMDRIAKTLNAEGVPTAKGGTWAAMTIKRVIDRAKEDVPAQG